MTTCDSCGYEWEYTGSLSRATCPNCSRKTRVETDEPTPERSDTEVEA